MNDPFLKWHEANQHSDEWRTESCDLVIEVFGHQEFFAKLGISGTSLTGILEDGGSIGPRSRGWADGNHICCRGHVDDIQVSTEWVDEFIRSNLEEELDSVIEDLAMFGIVTEIQKIANIEHPKAVLLEIGRMVACLMVKGVSEKIVIAFDTVGVFTITSIVAPPPALADMFRRQENGSYVHCFVPSDALALRDELAARS